VTFTRDRGDAVQCKIREERMSKAVKVVRRFLKDEDGAALIEYTVLLGILLIAVIATIGLVGTWVSKQWLALDKALSP
jgi:pilus assembly protein Flp/PilA